jgi:hypothetical protein
VRNSPNIIPSTMPWISSRGHVRLWCSREPGSPFRVEFVRIRYDELWGVTLIDISRLADFRSPQGLYARLQAEGKYELDDPQQMCDTIIYLLCCQLTKHGRFDIEYFKLYPEVF